jgi:hypothetical protein
MSALAEYRTETSVSIPREQTPSSTGMFGWLRINLIGRGDASSAVKWPFRSQEFITTARRQVNVSVDSRR